MLFDERSDHYLLRHRATGVYAATARMILPDLSAPLAPFPIERHCPFYDGLAIRDPEARRRLGELSRFAVSKAFKKRIGEAGSLIGVSGNVDMYFEPDERRVLPHLSLGLFAAELRMMHEHGLTHGYAVMEPALYRLLGRFGATFDQIGPAVDYHGERIPCLGDVNETPAEHQAGGEVGLGTHDRCGPLHLRHRVILTLCSLSAFYRWLHGLGVGFFYTALQRLFRCIS
jgi:N-acyl amino acid synthase of PEP-CTERM/exosortase system